jgi:hypothetical protein
MKFFGSTVNCKLGNLPPLQGIWGDLQGECSSLALISPNTSSMNIQEF